VRLRDHWWWRPGWRTGRHFYACHISFAAQTEFHRLAHAYQRPLEAFTVLDRIPTEWLHLTLQGVGFVDQISDEELDRVRDTVQQRLRALPPPVLTFDRPTVVPEAVAFTGRPAQPARQLWATVGDAITEALGPGRQYQLLEQADGFLPHVSIAYSNSTAPAEPVIQALDRVDAPPATVTLTHLHLMAFHRDHRMYQWRELAALPVGEA
jgi:2'-5' RNA ligase